MDVPLLRTIRPEDPISEALTLRRPSVRAFRLTARIAAKLDLISNFSPGRVRRGPAIESESLFYVIDDSSSDFIKHLSKTVFPTLDACHDYITVS